MALMQDKLPFHIGDLRLKTKNYLLHLIMQGHILCATTSQIFRNYHLSLILQREHNA
jgi:hypothetical protein